jgi:hypothetical protein
MVIVKVVSNHIREVLLNFFDELRRRVPAGE